MLCRCTHLVHNLFHRKIPPEGRARQETDPEGQRVPGNGDFLHSGIACHNIFQDRPRSRAWHHQNRHLHIRMPHRRHDVPCAAAAKQPLRPRSSALRVLRPHHCMEHVRGTDPTFRLHDHNPILRRTVASLHPRHTIPHRPRNAHHALLAHTCPLRSYTHRCHDAVYDRSAFWSKMMSRSMTRCISSSQKKRPFLLRRLTFSCIFPVFSWFWTILAKNIRDSFARINQSVTSGLSGKMTQKWATCDNDMNPES